MTLYQKDQNGGQQQKKSPGQAVYPFFLNRFLHKLYAIFFDVPDRYKVPLGEVLVRRGLLSEEQLQKALLLQLISDRKYGRSSQLGQILVEHGFVSEPEIIKAINDQYGIQAGGLSEEIQLQIQRRSSSLAQRILQPRLTIGAQLFLAATLLIVLVSGTFSYAMLERQREQLYNQTVTVGKVSLRYFQHNAPIPLLENNILALNTLIKGATETEGHLYAMIVDTDDHIKAHTDVEEIGHAFPGFGSITEQDRTGDITYFQYTNKSGNRILNLTAPITFQQKRLGQVHVGISLDFIQNMIRRERRWIVFISLAFVGITGLATLLMGIRFTGPISKLLVATREIARGNYRHRVDLRRNDELQDLAQAFNRMSNQLHLKAKLQESFGKYVGTEVLDMLITQPDSHWMKGTRSDATILFADVRGFTAFAENTEPEAVVEGLNNFFEITTEVIHEYGGFIDKFIGDAVLAVFGITSDSRDHALQAVKAALAMQEKLGASGLRHSPISLVGMGINSGPVVAGTIGSQQKMDYTVIGDTVNVASRLCDTAAANEIIISQSVLEKIGDAFTVKAITPQVFKGKSQPVPLYNVTGQVSDT